LAGRQGLEPRYADPESAVLPLDDLPGRPYFNIGPKNYRMLEGDAGGLSLPCPDAHGVLGHPGAAEVLEQEYHFVLLVLKRIQAARVCIDSRAVPVSLELLDRFRQLGTAAPAQSAAFQNAGTEELGNVLELVSGQAL
jgi:hypothetical protein